MHSTPRALVEIRRVNDHKALRMEPGIALVTRLVVLNNPSRLHPFNPCPWGHTHLLKYHANDFIPPLHLSCLPVPQVNPSSEK